MTPEYFVRKQWPLDHVNRLRLYRCLPAYLWWLNPPVYLADEFRGYLILNSQFFVVSSCMRYTRIIVWSSDSKERAKTPFCQCEAICACTRHRTWEHDHISKSLSLPVESHHGLYSNLQTCGDSIDIVEDVSKPCHRQLLPISTRGKSTYIDNCAESMGNKQGDCFLYLKWRERGTNNQRSRNWLISYMYQVRLR